MPSTASSRLAYIDWMRGLACVLMFQTHCYDSWLGGGARQGKFYMWSQLGGTLPAPLFLFLAGVSLALVVSKLHKKGLRPGEIASTTIRRGAEILALGFLFRLQEFIIAWGWAPWSDLLRVDILNTIGLSLMLMGAVCWMILRSDTDSPRRIFYFIGTAIAAAMLISLLTPMLWTTWSPDWLPWPLESYINGVHNLGKPQAWLFPLFPWTGFAFAGLAVGFLLLSEWVKDHQTSAFLAAGLAGVALIELSRWLDARQVQIYSVYDFWHTSPAFFWLRVGLLLIVLSAAYAWCRWGAGQWGFSPLVQLGQTSLLVYWVHLEFVYGRFSILPKRAQDIRSASVGLATIFLAMLGLSWLRTRFRGRGADVLNWLRTPAKAN